MKLNIFGLSIKAFVMFCAATLGGCQSRIGDLEFESNSAVRGGLELSERLSHEANRLHGLLRVDALLKLLLLLLVVALIQRLVRIVIRVAWRIGLDERRRLGVWENISRVVLVGGVGYIVLRKVGSAAPILGALGLLAV